MSEPTENTDEHRRFARRHDPTRVMALSDGVFAIVITLLVLEVHVPDLSGGRRLADALEEIRPSFVAFLISFLVIAIAWTGHRDLFSFIRLTDRNLVWLNLLYMLPLSLLPFGAALIARHPEEAVALRIYGLLLVAIALTRLLGGCTRRTGHTSCSTRSIVLRGGSGYCSPPCRRRCTSWRS